MFRNSGDERDSYGVSEPRRSSQNDCTRLQDSVIDGSQDYYQDILAKIKFIAKIGPDEVFDTANIRTLQKSWYTSFIRTISFNRDSRMESYKFIKDVYDKAFDICTNYVNRNDALLSSLAEQILDSLVESKKGIKNLAKTYAGDKMFVSQLETLESTLDSKIRVLNTCNKR